VYLVMQDPDLRAEWVRLRREEAGELRQKKAGAAA
jgi:hypothetical protein